MPLAAIDIPQAELSEFCRRNRIRRLALYGSVLIDRFSDTSDVDVLVEFEPGHRTGYLGMAALERQLSGLLGARKIDLRTPSELSPHFRDHVLATAAVQYERQRPHPPPPHVGCRQRSCGADAVTPNRPGILAPRGPAA